MVHEKISSDQYFEAIKELKREILQLNIPGILSAKNPNFKNGHIEFSMEFLIAKF